MDGIHIAIRIALFPFKFLIRCILSKTKDSFAYYLTPQVLFSLLETYVETICIGNILPIKKYGCFVRCFDP